MPGPKPNTAIVFRDIFKHVNRLRHASDTPTQETVISNLIAGLRKVEHLWNVTRLPNGALDLHRINAAGPQSAVIANPLYPTSNSKAWRDGYAAVSAGTDYANCPYPLGTQEEDDWCNGYAFAQDHGD